jgi:hypothetical protein
MRLGFVLVKTFDDLYRTNQTIQTFIANYVVMFELILINLETYIFRSLIPLPTASPLKRETILLIGI